jgi:hypothetical protein
VTLKPEGTTMKWGNSSMTLKRLSFPVKVLLTGFLISIGIGYVFAVAYLYMIDLEPHAGMGMGMVRAVIVKYYGKHGGTQLEAALNGAMADNITPAQKEQIERWIRNGATETGFAAVRPIFLTQCATCHSKASGLPVPSLTTFDEVRPYVRMNMGESVKTLVRVSHVHLFGISLIFFLTGGIFTLSEVGIRWRALLVFIPFAAIWLDIGSWWFTKVDPVFAYVVILGGILMGLSMAAQIILPLYEMWFKKTD